MSHVPVRPDGNIKNQVCQLHRFANREKLQMKGVTDPKEFNALLPGARKNVMFCETCGVKVCVDCWKIYHRVDRLGGMVEEILASK